MELIDREVAFNLGDLIRGFFQKTLDEDCAFNADKAHFSVNLDDGHILAMKSDTEVK